MRSIKRHWPTVIVLVLFLSSFSSAQNTTPDVRQLEQGKPIERELAGGAVHAYSIQMTEGQFLSVIVDQRGIDVPSRCSGRTENRSRRSTARMGLPVQSRYRYWRRCPGFIGLKCDRRTNWRTLDAMT